MPDATNKPSSPDGKEIRPNVHVRKEYGGGLSKVVPRSDAVERRMRGPSSLLRRPRPPYHRVPHVDMHGGLVPRQACPCT